MSKDAAKDLLLEIGVEELPARFVPAALAAIKSLAEKSFQEAGLPFKSLETLGTPRRLALLVHGLASKAQDRTHESLGPGMAQAKDKDGNWTPAAQGFARSQNTTPEKLDVRETDRGPRLVAVRKDIGQAAEKVLPLLLPELIKKIPFAKNMVWEEGRMPFARPIRWILALHDKQTVKFSLAGVKAGNKTYSLRIHGGKPVSVPAPAKYASLLKDLLVVVDPHVRRDLVEKQVHQSVKAVKGHVPTDKFSDLLDEVTNLVEHPVGLLGSFDDRYLELPAEVLVTSMKKHQKYFPVFDGGGRLLPHFVGIRNGMSENQVVVKEGYQRVLAARLADAAFFYREDLKTRLEAKAPLLKSVLFQKELGSVWEKSERIAALSAVLADLLALSSEDKDEAQIIARLGKADLVSAMVGEFPELQGTMGRIYAQAEGLPFRLAQGLEQHYWPLTAEGALPETSSAALVALADKLDTLAGDFLVGLIPTGSQDPYGLRRAAVGVLRIVEARGWHLPLQASLERALAAFPDPVKGDRAKTLQALLDFFRQRWSAIIEAEGFRPDEIAAVTSAGFDDPLDAKLRFKALHDVRRHPDFEPLATAFKRSANILKQARQKGLLLDAPSVNEALLSDSAEKGLHQSVRDLTPRVEPLLAAGRFSEALHALVSLRQPVDAFFNGVMVMAPEPEVRANRLALLAGVTALFRRTADLSQLQDVPVAVK
jgi:glycyl-tRNA synthetase beta chain